MTSTSTISAYSRSFYDAWTASNEPDRHEWAWAYLSICGVADTVYADDTKAFVEGCDDLIDTATGDYRNTLITAVETVLGHFGLL